MGVGVGVGSAVARPSDATIKRLFAMSHNLCAHARRTCLLALDVAHLADDRAALHERLAAVRWTHETSDSRRYVITDELVQP